MCFSVNVNLIKEELEERYGINFPDKYRYEPSYYYHAFGLPEIPAVCSGNPESFQILKWGLIPPWTKTTEAAQEIRFKTFNARAESIDTKPLYSSSFRTKRCLIPVKGFYEWQHVGKNKIPWYIYHAGEDIFTIAGLYSEWKDPGTDEHMFTFSIITTEANEIMAEIHNSKMRMPVILSRNEENKWVDLSLSLKDAEDLLKPCNSEDLKAHTISPLVSSRTADKNTPEIIRPYNYNTDKESLLF